LERGKKLNQNVANISQLIVSSPATVWLDFGSILSLEKG
jgi:hypothetical protein